VPQYLAPPGYLSIDQLKARAAVGDKLHGAFDFKLVSDALFVAVGTADKVANQIGEWGEMMGTTHFNIQGALGDMPHWKVMKNLQLIAEDVIPRVRGKQPARLAAE
jgi:alkanesulfonate monooxygenase SsuD/methylene tetrahydromethanopterin reductase-like flavin-dependent oxidoreductase (luciferase family)